MVSPDDRYYDILNRSGDTYQKYRGQVAEENAQHAREMGQIYGQMPGDLVHGYMTGASFADKRAADASRLQSEEQQRSLAAAGEQRNQAAEAERGLERQRGARRWNTEERGLNDTDTIHRIEMEHANRQVAPGSEEAKNFGYQGAAPISRAELGIYGKERGEQTGLQSGQQQLANSKQAAMSMSQQMAQTSQQMKDARYDNAVARSQNELKDITMIPDPTRQAAALDEWRSRHSGLLDKTQLTNMAEGGVAHRQADLKSGAAQMVASNKLIYGSALQEAQQLTDKLADAQTLLRNADAYKNGSYLGGAYEDSYAKDARAKSAQILAKYGDHEAADKVQTGSFAGGRDILGESARNKAQEVAQEFNTWYMRQDQNIQQMPEVIRAKQQADQVASQTQGQGGPALRTLPSLTGQQPGARGNTNAGFMSGLKGENAPTQLPQAPMTQPAMVGATNPDPYGLEQNQQQQRTPAGVSRGNRG